LKQTSAATYEAEIRRQAARTLADTFDRLYEGAFAIDRSGRIVWMNEKFKAILGWNGLDPVEGQPVEEVVPGSRLRQVVETGQPELLDIFVLGQRQLTVSRIPLTDDAGRVVGAMGVILFDRLQALKPLVSKFQGMQRDLETARRALAESRASKYRFDDFVGSSAPVLTLKRHARRAAETDRPVLLLGETGTGKELLAHAIHDASPRSARPMVRVNMAAIPETLLEAELFGVAPGAYTGADKRGRTGKMQLADGGTLFLDEVGDMPLALQPKLLRVLEEQEVEPLGSDRLVPVDVRVIAATSRDLKAMAAAGTFRADLYYRLSVLPLLLPPLRDRREDLAQLVDVLLAERSAREGGPREVDAGVLARLAAHDWPGNVRELRNVLEQAAVAAGDADRIAPAHLNGLLPAVAPAFPPEAPAAAGPGGLRPLRETLAEAERAAILAALAAAGGVKLQAARLLGISRAQFYEKLGALGLLEEKRAG